MLFKSARQIIESLDNESLINKVKLLVDGGEYVLFIKHDGKIYAGDESTRVTLAKLKDRNDEDNDRFWREFAFFTAVNCVDALNGKNNQKIFSSEDLKDIKIITDRKSIFEEIISCLGN